MDVDKENKRIGQNVDVYMNYFSLVQPIGLSEESPRAGHSQFGYTANTILRTVVLTSKNLQNWVILNPGASSYFLLSNALVISKRIARRQLTATIANGDAVRSSNIAELNFPLTPRDRREAHVMPGLASYSLVSVVELYNTRCQMNMRDILCEIQYKGRTIV